MAIGDLSGDGKPGLVIPCRNGYYANPSSRPSGNAYAFFSPVVWKPEYAIGWEKANILVAGAEVGDALGGSLALGDVNGDGVVDMVVGAAGANGHGTFVTAPARPKDADIWYNLGEAYIVFGGPKLDCLPRPVHTAGLKATRSGDNVNLKWDTASDAATAAYDVWSVQDQDKGTIRLANRALQGTRVVAACTPPPPLASPQCTDAGAVSRPPALVFYQVRPTCADGTEGLDGAY